MSRSPVRTLALASQALYASGFRGLAAKLDTAIVEYIAMRSTLDAAREASRRHPETCDRHDPGDPIQCGWKRAVIDMRNALEGEGRP